MTTAVARDRAAVRWLLMQAVAFGIMAALLGVVANALFLEEYGSSWLPLTYVFIALAGLLVSGTVATSVRRWSLLRVATAVLGGGAAVLAGAWVIAAFFDGAWVSAPLLVLFPVLLQLGFVFIGGQAGRILDIGGIKRSFPRVMAGFPLGAIAGGIAASALVTLFGRAEHLLAAAAIAQAAFLVILVATGRRFAGLLAFVEPASVTAGEPSPRRWRLPAGGLVAVILSYQVLSAIGSQLADFLVFDRAAARYGDGEDLARFIARYTAVMNIVSIAFLAIVAGSLLRRFGLRLGIVANPAVLAVFAAAMVVATAAAGSASTSLFAVVAFARIADIALTDGTTRTSINATYQVLPNDERLTVQAQVEGVGVPLAIGFSGVLVLILDWLPFAVPALVVTTLAVCIVWTIVGERLHDGYVSALAAGLRRRRLVDEDQPFVTDESEQAAARRLLDATEGRDVRAGLDLLLAMSSPAVDAELSRLAADARPDVRVAALEHLAKSGDETARRQLAGDVASMSTSSDVDQRRAAARALVSLDGDGQAVLAALVRDPDAGVRHDALGAVGPGDTRLVDDVIDALADVRTSAAASAALARLGDAVVPAALARLPGSGVPVPAATTRLVRALRVAAPGEIVEALQPYLFHRDREFGLAVLVAVAGATPASEPLAVDSRRVLDGDIRSAARVVAAIASLEERFTVLRRALDDELVLLRERVAAAVTVIFGTDRVGPALRAIDVGDPLRTPLAVESLELTLDRAHAAPVLAVVLPDRSTGERATGLRAFTPRTPAAGWLEDLVDDPDDHWRAPWLRICATYTAECAGPDAHVSSG